MFCEPLTTVASGERTGGCFMDVFTDVYKKSTDLLKSPCFDQRWSNIEAKLKALLAADGPSDADAAVLDLVRSSLATAGRGAANVEQAVADEILKICRKSTAGFQDRAALVKMLKHFYFVEKKGNQSIWAVDNAKAYSQWTYDLFSTAVEKDINQKLQQNEEVYGDEYRKLMSDALQLARKWSMDIVAKLPGADATTLGIVKRWFHESGATDEKVKVTAAVLLDGFKRISATCNSTKVIFSDRPHKRVTRVYDSVYASVNPGDKMPVIYIFKLFLAAGAKDSKGQIGKLWLCALTVIHELSHKIIGTKDLRYDDDGLKPGSGLSEAQALNNADSWGYFAADMAGCLPSGTFASVYK
jgi:hypothetical protein